MYCDHPVCSPIKEEHNDILQVEDGHEKYETEHVQSEGQH